MKILKTLILTAAVSLCGSLVCFAQDESQIVVLPAIVEMPVIPEQLTDIQDRYSYFVDHYWDKFDFKQNAVGQIQLDDAFDQYATALRFAPEATSLKSVESLLKKLDKNPTMLYQFCVAAENTLYNPQRASVLIDGLYVKFLEAVLKNKKLKPERKSRFAVQYAPLHQSLVGQQAPQFSFENRTGVNTLFNAEARKTIIVFGHPDCADCMMAKIKLEMNTDLDSNCKDGEIRVYFIIPDKDSESWKEMVADYPHYWTVGATEDVEEIYDLRFNPSIYVLDADRKIVLKTTSAEQAIDAALAK